MSRPGKRWSGELIPPAALLVANLSLFGPFHIYAQNAREFSVPLHVILGRYVVPSVVLLVGLCVLGLFVPRKHYQKGICVLFALGFLTWLQQNILVWDYGLLDGRAIDWGTGTWRGWLDGVLWIFVISLAVIFFRHQKRYVGFTSILLLLLQFGLLGITTLQRPTVWTEHLSEFHEPTDGELVPKDIFRFSSDQNVIHLVLDSFQSDIFESIVESAPEQYSPDLDGFTFFRETTGSFPVTWASIPALLSGVNYKNQVPRSQFESEILRTKTIGNILFDGGYEVDVVTWRPHYMQGKMTNFFAIPFPYVSEKKSLAIHGAALLADLVFFRTVPHFLKRYVYNDQMWLFRPLAGQSLPWQFSGVAFLDDLIKKASVGRRGPVYKYFHFIQAHGPGVMAEDCQFAGQTLPPSREAITTQSKCTLEQVIAFLRTLRELGIRDSSLIVVNADHGGWIPPEMRNMDDAYDQPLPQNVGAALPLLAIKPPYATGPLRTSDAQTMLIDIPATIFRILDVDEHVEGRSVFDIEEGEIRERSFYHHTWTRESQASDFLDRLDEYVIRGSVFDRWSWSRGATYFPPEGLNPAAQITEIDIGSESASRYLDVGWSFNEGSADEGVTYRWALGRNASILLELPTDRELRLTARMKATLFDHQSVTVTVDGHNVVQWEIPTNWQWVERSVIIKTNTDRPKVSRIEFTFSNHRDPKARDENGKRLRPLALLFDSVTLTDVDE